ncbi:hypoxanthine-guanine phosphoribosyltransferase [Wohlfahrtiimonas chitiniclastica]|uniref:hypoxanthine-guanine phosphoribosyltransferase n=1 Tax=Wohlfahrtiimonas chitiniclastica TaxID=400946 RepID=UPI0007B41DEE|nr:hypoxanthine-guanine phosphoribosyltransferase [Wohlfahrtiimonas chitiniclastica]KZS23609.1 hypoxanthine-guanine phosphoribosyltransferase [Wohlfahrtiimonas chitiniclastica]WHR56002.1 hypoxanthine-guanine phosphoribosyltransferase [Wohlfahrtiimonas chitiniclastica]
MSNPDNKAQQILANSEEIISAQAVNDALDQMAVVIEKDLHDADPVVLVVMNGALIPGGLLLSRLNFPFRIGYLHATRYRGETTGGELHWVAPPSIPVAGRPVLLVDDIFDEGNTLEAITLALTDMGATKVYTATLFNKVHTRKPKNFKVDYIGLDVPDRYVFGCGMDCHEYWRNLRSIWALNES